MVLPDSDRVSRVPPYSGTVQMLQTFAYGIITLYDEPFQTLLLIIHIERTALQPHGASTMVWAIPISLATTHGIIIIFSSSGYLDVSVLRVFFSFEITGLQPAGLPHSDIRGLMVVCTSPQLFAAYHVLRSLWEPRHPPYALISFLLFIHNVLYLYKLLFTLFASVLSMNFLSIK